MTIYNRHIVYSISNIDNTYIASDNHYDHTNIIEYCSRPFSSTEEMNKTILDNYNKVVKEDSLFIFLGDMAFGRKSKTPKYWLSQLRGKVLYFKGSHDHGIRVNSPIEGNLIDICTSAIIKAGNREFYLTHDPEKIPPDWLDWTIHGHMHNTVPFIDRDKKRVCVSLELINYTPISLREIINQTS